ncbi:hypothetical protein JHK87_055314 [Glycine soja]|nr:hypothetical protein JHK87_055314 [Glycine soja]
MEGLSLVEEEEDGFSLKIQEDTGHNYDIEHLLTEFGYWPTMLREDHHSVVSSAFYTKSLRLSVDGTPKIVTMHDVLFWIPIHNLPIGFMIETVGKHLGNFVGEFMEYDPNNNLGVWRAYMRIQVRVDRRLPLKKVKKPGGEWRLV